MRVSKRFDIFALSERMMGMSDAVWERHAHPFSAWSRVVLGAPLLVLAIWSRDWIGWWSLLALYAVLVFVWLNPRMTPRPKYTDSWASRGVMGERVFLARRDTPIPAEHARLAHILTGVAALGVAPLAWGLWRLEVWPTLLGLALVYLGKMWFVDRMVWLYDDMRQRVPEYQAWYRPKPGREET